MRSRPEGRPLRRNENRARRATGRIRSIGIWLAIGAGITCVAAPAAAEVIDRVLAVVSGTVITLSDVTAAHDLGIVPAVTGSNWVGPVLEDLIDRTLILTEVDRFSPPEPAADAIDRGVAEIRARFPSQPAFDAALARSGVDQAHLRELVRQNLRLREYLDLRFSVPPPTEQEVGDYYQAHQGDFAVNGQPGPLDQVRPRVVAAINASRQQALVDDWVSSLRSRSDIVNLYATRQQGPDAGRN